jgi:hypothetical protein
MRNGIIQLLGSIILSVVAVRVCANDVQLASPWDQGLLETQIHHVHFKSRNVRPSATLQKLLNNYLIRANIYFDLDEQPDPGVFRLDRETATVREILNAFVVAYPTYAYVQQPKSGVIWFYPRKLKFDDILNHQVKIRHGAIQFRRNESVFQLAKTLSFVIDDGYWKAVMYSSGDFVDLPQGIYSSKEVFDLLCLGSPSISYIFAAQLDEPQHKGPIVIGSLSFNNLNPLASPRDTLIKFWEIEIGKSRSTNAWPSTEEVVSAMADSNPRKRWAAREYFESAMYTYDWHEFVRAEDDPERAIWAALSVEFSIFHYSIGKLKLPGCDKIINDQLARVTSPTLALVLSLEFAGSSLEASRFDNIVRNHAYSEEELAQVKSDVYRIIIASHAAREKLLLLDLNVPGFLKSDLIEIEKLAPIIPRNPDMTPNGLFIKNTNVFEWIHSDKH